MSLLLAHSIGEWEGTFALAAETIIRDLLDDGPVPITINGSFSETIVGYNEGNLILRTGHTVNLLDVHQLEVR